MAKSHRMSSSLKKLAVVPEEPSELEPMLDVESAATTTTMRPIDQKFTVLDPSQFRRAPYGRPSSILKVALYASLAWNVVLALALVGYYYRATPHEYSRYAKLPRRRTAWNFSTMYGSRALEDEQRGDQLWDSYRSSGVVALSNERARHWHLPQAQPLPWDHDYSLYTISGMHSLECLKRLRRSVVQTQRGEAQTDSYADLLYCADVLRQDVICHADDTPMYTSTSHSRLDTGDGQTRMCRDWSRLEEWYESHAACYEKGESVSSELVRSKNCPAESRFAPPAEEYSEYFYKQ